MNQIMLNIVSVRDQIDALLKADPLPPRWALLRVLSLLEEHYEKAENTTALRMLNQLR